MCCGLQGVNQFTDMTDDQRRRFLGSAVTRRAQQQLMGARVEAELPPVRLEDLPSAVDWRTVQPSIITPYVLGLALVLVLVFGFGFALPSVWGGAAWSVFFFLFVC